jgi:glycosyltransferase involved in cell wall biosynthesis
MPGPCAPFFTIGVPAYNAADVIAETIESVLAQTMTCWELVIVDDGSADATYEVASGFADRDPRIRVLRADHGGSGAARNKAYESSAAPFLLRLDADDLLLPGCLEKLRAFIEARPGYQVYSFRAERLYEDGHTEPMLTAERWASVSSVTLEEVIRDNPIFTMAAIDREAYWKVGGTRPVLVEDYDFWLRILLAGARHIYMPEILARYRIHPAQTSARNGLMLQSRIEVLEELAVAPGMSAERVRLCRYSIAVLKKRLLEQKIRDGDAHGILPLFREAKPAYRNMLKYYTALVAGVFDERLLARVVTRGRPIGQAERLR